MPSYMVTLKDGAAAKELETAKELAKSKGGTITHEYTLVKGFAVDYPADSVGVLESNDHLNVEAEGTVTTQ